MRNQNGMTLLEIMIVVAIISGLIAILAPNITAGYEKSKARQGVIQLNSIMTALHTYSLDCGSMPTEEQGLHVLVADPGPTICQTWGPRPYLKEAQLKDPYGHEFIYRHDKDGASLTFLGRDGREGGSGLDRDTTVEE